MTKEAKKEKDEAKRIMALHGMIKKHTILVYITVGTFVAWFASTYIEPWMWTQVIWELLINIVCIWLMFAESDRYWQCARKYCICHLCYAACCKKRDIDGRIWICFC